MDTKALFENDFVGAPLGQETGFFEKTARLNNIPQSMVPELKENFLDWSRSKGSGPASIREYVANFVKKMPELNAPVWCRLR